MIEIPYYSKFQFILCLFIFFLFSTRIHRYYILILTLKIVKKKERKKKKKDQHLRRCTSIPHISVISHMIFISHLCTTNRKVSIRHLFAKRNVRDRLSRVSFAVELMLVQRLQGINYSTQLWLSWISCEFLLTVLFIKIFLLNFFLIGKKRRIELNKWSNNRKTPNVSIIVYL